MTQTTIQKITRKKTQSASRAEAIASRGWFVIDAKGQVLGRLASRIAHVLRGKHKVCYTPHVDAGDFVIVLNAEQVQLTGGKEEGKLYRNHSGYIGGLKESTAKQLRARRPTELLTRAVRGMLPKTTLGRDMLGKLKVYAEATHPHTAQQPQTLTLSAR